MIFGGKVVKFKELAEGEHFYYCGIRYIKTGNYTAREYNKENMIRGFNGNEQVQPVRKDR